MVDNVQIWTDYWWKRTSNLWNWKYWEKVEKSDNCFQLEMRWLWPNLTTIVAALSGAFRAKGKRLRLATQNHFYTIENKKIQILKCGFSDLPFTTFLSGVRVSRSRQDPERRGCISNSTIPNSIPHPTPPRDHPYTCHPLKPPQCYIHQWWHCWMLIPALNLTWEGIFKRQ